MTYIVTTYTGSKYKIDLSAKTWERIASTDRSGAIRTDSGTFDWMGEITIGRSLNLICPAINAAATGRLISTSGVVSFEEYEPARVPVRSFYTGQIIGFKDEFE